MEKLECPYIDCDGTLNLCSEETTTLGCLVINTNTHYQSFICDKCKRTVTRSWWWENEE